MELVYYRLTFNNQREYVVVLNKNEQKSFEQRLKDFSTELSLKQNESNSFPVTFSPGTLFNRQQISEETISKTQSRTWSLV